ncbi:zinc finger transcription factor Trps1-like [Thalassophryne amazonica]|uniref:zinc finger transcription factor Trps1-like n=1 Tax=Thalassophryne amazonica TaxID=390379 RepID=UPI001471489F|nr:zinc finger transcription factor Trps1-like [Thalassophryne amazonica]
MLDIVERVVVRAEDDSLVGYSIPVQASSDSASWAGEAGRGSVQAYYWCKFCSWSCEWAGGSSKLIEHYEERHRMSTGGTMSPNNSNPPRPDRERAVRRDEHAASKSKKDLQSNSSSTSKGDLNSSESEAVVTSYNCQLCDFRYSMAHSADVIVVAPLLLHYQHNHSIQRCCIQHCMYCPQGLCQPHKHLGEVSHPFACRKPTCAKCCSRFPQSIKQQDAIASKPATATSPSMTPPTPRSDPGRILLQPFILLAPRTLLSLKLPYPHQPQGGAPHVKAEEDTGGEKEGGGARGGEREFPCSKCHFITEVEEEIFRHYSTHVPQCSGHQQLGKGKVVPTFHLTVAEGNFEVRMDRFLAQDMNLE